jgi:ElaB/YqjD/DUF883 family membrane-anchored ribosome-binding protein
MNKIYEELSLIKESHNPEYKLILEGFWDKIGSAVGKAVGRTKNAIEDAKDAGKNAINKGKELGQRALDAGKNAINKGKELGQRALDAGKKLMNDIAANTTKAIDYIKSAPEKILDSLSNLFQTASDNVAKLYAEAVEKGGEWLTNAKTTIKNIYDKIAGQLANSYQFVKKWIAKNGDRASKMIQSKQDKINNWASSAKQSSNEGLKKIGTFFTENLPKILNKGAEIAKNAGLIALGLIVLSLQGSYLILKKIGKMGEEAFKFIESGLNIIKTNLGESWDLTVNGYKEGEQGVRDAHKEYKNRKNLDADNNNRIYSFTEFVNEKYNRINIAK